MSEQTAENKMGVKPEGRLLFGMSLPMMISMLVQALYNIVDSIFVAKIDQDALTAVSLAFPMQLLMVAIGAGTGVGVNALISRSLGEKRQDRANAVAANGIFVYILSYLAILVIALLFVRPFYAMQTNEEQRAIMEYGVKYLSIVMIFSFGIFAQFLFERMLQATGRTLFTMFSQGIGAIINLIFDPLLIFGIGPFPEMGISGAAIATVMGQIIAGCIALWGNIALNKDIHISLKGFKPEGEIIKSIYKIGVPSIIMQSIGSVMTTGMNLILMPLSDTAAAVFGVYFKLQSFFFMPVIGLNNGLIPIISYNYGARKKKRIINTLKYGYIIAFAFLLAGIAAFELIPDKLLMLFDASDDMIAIGCRALRIIGLHFLIAWFCIITGSMFQAMGNAVYSMYVSICRQLVVLLPAAFILATVGGVDAIWWSFPLAELMSAAVTLVCMKKTAGILKGM